MSNVPLSSINMDLNAEEFITSETAKLNLRATFALTDITVDARAEILNSAKQIADGEWYVTDVQRGEDASGIDTTTFNLSIRIPERDVAAIKSKIKNVNRAGLKFVLDYVDYTPTKAQIEEGNKSLRRKIYEKAKDELNIIQDAFGSGLSEDGWMIGDIHFNSNGPAMSKNSNLRGGTALYATANAMMNESAEDGGQGITQKLTLAASVQFVRKIYNRL